MHSTSFCFLPALLLLCSATSHLGQSISIVPITRRLAYEHHLLQPHRQPALRPRQGDSLDDLRCEDLTDSFDPTCWDTLGMREWMIQWDDDNSKNGSCENDLWANCFLRQAGLLNVTDLRCEQMGNGTCQPDEQVLSNPTVQYIYGAYSIWGECSRRNYFAELHI